MIATIIPDYIQRRWVLARWNGTDLDTIAEHYLVSTTEVRAALRQAAVQLRRCDDAVIGVLVREEAEVLECYRNTQPGSGPPLVVYANWKAGLAKGEYSSTPAMPRIREDTPWNLAEDRWTCLLRMLEE